MYTPAAAAESRPPTRSVSSHIEPAWKTDARPRGAANRQNSRPIAVNEAVIARSVFALRSTVRRFANSHPAASTAPIAKGNP